MNNNNPESTPPDNGHSPHATDPLTPANAQERYKQLLTQTERDLLHVHRVGLCFYYNLGKRVEELKSGEHVWGRQVVEQFMEDMTVICPVAIADKMYQLSHKIARALSPEELELAIQAGMSLRNLKHLARPTIGPALRHQTLLEAVDRNVRQGEVSGHIRLEMQRAEKEPRPKSRAKPMPVLKSTPGLLEIVNQKMQVYADAAALMARQDDLLTKEKARKLLEEAESESEKLVENLKNQLARARKEFDDAES